MNQARKSGIADPGIEAALECRIEAASEYQFGQPIAINGTLRNTGASDIWILVRNTFLAPNWQDCARLTHNRSSVPYTGVVVFHNTPSRGSYLRIPAGESVSRKIDLGEKYAITEPGDYEVSFYLPILGAVDEGASEPPADQKALQLKLVESAKVSFRISGTAPAPTTKRPPVSPPPRSPQAAFPLQPTEPIYLGMSQDQQAAVHRAHFTAYNNILLALENVQKSIDAPNRLYCEWFDVLWIWGRTGPWQQRRQTVIDTLTSMASLMSASTPITYQYLDPNPTCTFDMLAYTYINSTYVFPCSNFFNDDLLRFSTWNSAEWARAFVVVHEISHAASGTTDDWYSWSICQQLASYNPNLAVVNAQNYALYVMLRQGGDLPMTNKYKVRCYDETSNAFLGWLDSSGNWLSVIGTDPSKPEGVTVYWYEFGGERFLSHTDSSRYAGDNGNKGQGNTGAAWNLWSRATAAEWSEPTGQICISANKSQHLIKGADGLYWSADSSNSIRFEFIEV